MDKSTNQPAVPVTVENFPRAETDLYFNTTVKQSGFGKYYNYRELMPIDHQTVIRANRDTLYAAAVFDLDAGPVTITLPDAGKRFMSMQVFDQDEYTPMVVYGKGSYTLTRDKVGTRYTMTGLRILVNPDDPKDVDEVHRLQDAVKVSQKSPGAWEIPKWDKASQDKVRSALLILASTLPDMSHAFGAKGQVDPVRHLIGAASAWEAIPTRTPSTSTSHQTKRWQDHLQASRRQERPRRRLLVHQPLRRQRLLPAEPLQRLHPEQPHCHERV